MIEATGLEKLMEGADIVVTGEGRIDGQTAMGKVPTGVARIAKKHNCKVVALSGSVANDATECNKCGIDGIFAILQEPMSIEEAMDTENTQNNLIRTAEQIFRIL